MTDVSTASSEAPRSSPAGHPAPHPAPHLDMQTYARRACLILIASLLAWAVVRAATLGYSFERDLWLARISGWTAAASLLLSLSMTPLARLNSYVLVEHIPRTLWPALRRALGITAASAALAHAAWVAFAYLDRSWSAIVAHAYLRAGLISLCILLPLLLTSFPAITRKLRVRLWKPLHRLSYLAAAFLLQHLLLSPFASRRWIILVFSATLLLGLCRLLPLRGRRQS